MNSGLKNIYIVRHAKSSWSHIGLHDFDRPLNKRGLRSAPFMAKKLFDFGAHLNLILSSPSKRTRATAEYFSEQFGCKMEPIKNLYHGDVEDIMEALFSLGPEINSVGIIAHNPGITYFANEISDQTIDNVPTCGVLVCSVNSHTSWQDLLIQDIKLKQFINPKMYF
jgi:phosphohistidine phosphatase